LCQVLEMAVEDYWEEMVRKEQSREKNTSRVILCYSETVIKPLPGYDSWRLRTLVRVQRWTGECKTR
jgi:hypothetical protein